MAKLTTKEFIKKAQEVHGDRYDYSKVEYVNNQTPVEIVCHKHGNFWQSPHVHLQGKGCLKCGRERIATFHTKSLKQFLQEAKRIHGNKYDYSKVKYVDSQTKVIIICPVHGEFTQIPTTHLQGSGCPKCGKERKLASMRMTQEGFINKAKSIHGSRYDYSKVEYVDYKTPVTIICSLHGSFPQSPKNHLSGYGCSICSGRKKMRTIDFIKRANQIHHNKYDYSRTEYRGNAEEVWIICPEHGEFRQQAGSHLRGAGCPKCGIIKSSAAHKIWTRERCYETALKYKDIGTFSKECQFAYVIAHRNGWLKEYTWLTREKMPNGYWTKELVMEEAQKCISSSEFQKRNLLAYNAAVNHGWIKECTWFVKPKNAKKWNYNTCFDEAQKYTSRTEFRTRSITAYCIARDRGWLDDYNWLEKRINPYNYESCKFEALKHQYYNDFRAKAHQHYMVARKRGWLRDYTWLIIEPLVPYNKKWNYDTCYAEAKKYKTRGEFNKKGGGAYDVARRNGWLIDYTWMPDFSNEDAKVDSVYYYLFEKQNAVYVGRTLMYRQHIRDIEHHNLERDAVFKFAQKNDCEIPPMQIIEENLTILEGREREDYWRKHYETKGCIILNTGVTGIRSGSIGALARGKWTFEKAYRIAQCFETVKEMCEEYEYLYKISKARGWLEKFDWFRGKEIKIEKQTKWTEEVCRGEALKYTSRKDFRRMCRGAYDKAKETGWLEDYIWLSFPKPSSEWNYESCEIEAKKYGNKFEFQKKSYSAYQRALREGWLDDFYPNPLRRVLDHDTCERLASKYQTPRDMLKADRSLYETIKKNGWMNDFFSVL